MADERWLVTGASGQLGGHIIQRLAREAGRRSILALVGKNGVEASGVEVRRVDLGDTQEVGTRVADYRPTHIAHVGALTSVADAYARPDDADRINVQATRCIAEQAAVCGARLVFTSTDMVFAGSAAPYREDDPPSPLSHYGNTKVAAEKALAEFDRTLVVRIPLMYGAPVTGRETTFTRQIAALTRRRPLHLFTDEYRTPVWLGDAAAALIALVRSELTGIMHVSGPQRLSRYEMGEHFARVLNIAEPSLEAVSRISIQAAEPRPEDLSLDGTRFNELFPDLAPGPIRAEAFTSPCG